MSTTSTCTYVAPANQVNCQNTNPGSCSLRDPRLRVHPLVWYIALIQLPFQVIPEVFLNVHSMILLWYHSVRLLLRAYQVYFFCPPPDLNRPAGLCCSMISNAVCCVLYICTLHYMHFIFYPWNPSKSPTILIVLIVV